MNKKIPSLPTNIDDFRPGVLSRRQIEILGEKGIIKGLIKEDIDPSSFDLHLDWEGWVMKGGIKCIEDKDVNELTSDKQFIKKQLDITTSQKLEKGQTYLFRLKESLHFPKNSNLFGRATGRSSIGRLDVLARLLTNRHHCYDDVRCDYDGPLYIEITPITFPIKIIAGISISQLRIFKGVPELSEIKAKELELFGELLYGTNEERITDPEKISQLTLNLKPIEIGGNPTSAYKANNIAGLQPIDLSAPKEKYDPKKYWRCEGTSKGWIKIETEMFYILRSRERFCLPEDIAVYGLAVSENLGEIRIHYAGFAHPWFGHHKAKEKGKPLEKGTPLIFEVRGHNVATFLRDGEVLANIKYYRMSERIDKTDKRKVEKGSYQTQALTLSKYFKPWK